MTKKRSPLSRPEAIRRNDTAVEIAPLLALRQ